MNSQLGNCANTEDLPTPGAPKRQTRIPLPEDGSFCLGLGERELAAEEGLRSEEGVVVNLLNADIGRFFRVETAVKKDGSNDNYDDGDSELPVI